MSATEASNSQSSSGSQSNAKQGLVAGAEYLSSHKRDCLLWISRVITMMFTFCYLFPIASGNQSGYYYKALMANAFTSVVRLNQRLPRVEFSRIFLAHLLQEDSCHYIFYSLIFLYVHPATLVLLPVFLFAFLHSTFFAFKLFQALGWNEMWLATKLLSVTNESLQILRLIAFAEIFIMPLSIYWLFIGKGSLLTPIIYYRFLTLRYQSRRNPCTRTVFCNLRQWVDFLADLPVVPDRLTRLCNKLVELISRLAPPVTAD